MNTYQETPADVQACPEGSYAVTAWIKLVGWAGYIAARFDAPVYLVGSSLRVAEPRDVDVRIVMDDAQFLVRYKQTPPDWLDCPSQRWINEVAKLNRVLVSVHKLPADVQIMPYTHSFKYADEPRVLLATPTTSPDVTPCGFNPAAYTSAAEKRPSSVTP